MRKLSKNIIPFIVVVVVGCSKTEVLEQPSYLNIIKDSIHFNYPSGAPSSYYMIDYKATPLSRVSWTSPDSFLLSIVGDTLISPSIGDKIEKMSVVNYSTYTRDDSTGRQGVFIDSTFIGDILNIYAESYDKKDTFLILIK